MNKPKTHAEVPDAWKHPMGPYRQAPDGQWWFVNPFTASGTTDNASPWERFQAQPEPEALPEGFEDIFGPLPEFKGFTDSAAWTTARSHWRQNLEQFKGAGRPLWLAAEDKAELDALYQAWGMGKPRFYGGRYGEMVRWPDSEVQDFEDGAFSAANYPHHTIARYQIDLVQSGGVIPRAKRHPLVPGHVFNDEE